ncbi:MAG: cation transporter [Clostridium sp.]
MAKLVATITGMSCGHCVKHVEDALKDNAKVDNFDVKIGLATVEGSITKEELKELIEEEGYDVVEIAE